MLKQQAPATAVNLWRSHRPAGEAGGFNAAEHDDGAHTADTLGADCLWPRFVS
jgi:hypothetical protein